jgi:hypothetical protein
MPASRIERLTSSFSRYPPFNPAIGIRVTRSTTELSGLDNIVKIKLYNSKSMKGEDVKSLTGA